MRTFRHQAVVLALAALVCGGTACQTGQPLRAFDTRRYMGDWYVQRIWGTGAGSTACMRMSYQQAEDESVAVKNSMIAVPYLNPLTLSGVKRMSGSEPGRFMVYPSAGPLNIAPTPSWVVALDPDYQWAAVAAGPPTQPSALGCVPSERTGGMTIMTRLRDPPGALMKQALASMALQGYDTSMMTTVRQDGFPCM